MGNRAFAGGSSRALGAAPVGRKERAGSSAGELRFSGNTLRCGATVDSYLASALVDVLRNLLLKQGRDVCFESVMSHSGKVAFLDEASSLGARTYLYYVATEDPEINVARVQDRVRKGGHDVPAEKIRKRYQGSLDNLLPAMKVCHRAFIFDNSGESLVLVAELNEGVLSLRTE